MCVGASLSERAEPPVAEHWSTRDPVRPTWLSLVPALKPYRFPARWVLTGLQHVVDRRWMQWAGVTHVINCIGPMKGSQPNPTFCESVEKRVEGIRYLTWTASNAACRRDYRQMLSTIHYLLGDPRVCLLVHCIHSRDRSVFLVALYCVAVLGMSITDTVNSVLSLHESRGNPPVKLQRLYTNTQFSWLQSVEAHTRKEHNLIFLRCRAFDGTLWVVFSIAGQTWRLSIQPRGAQVREPTRGTQIRAQDGWLKVRRRRNALTRTRSRVRRTRCGRKIVTPGSSLRRVATPLWR